MKTGRNVLNRLRRLERAHGTGGGDSGEPVWARLLYLGSATRRQALEWFWGIEQREATQQGRPPDPQRPILMLELIDQVYPLKVVQQNLRIDRATSLAYDFRGWTRAEIGVFAAAQDALLPQPQPSDEAAMLGASAKVDALMTAAEKTWAQDLELMRLIAGGADLGGVP